MADWQAFATAFLGDSATYINERKDKAEDYADKLAEQAERNKGKLAELRQTADAQNSFVGQARALHATDAQIEAALDAGPNGLSTLVNTLDTLRATYGSNFNADMVKEAAALPEAFSPTGNLDVYARYGLGSQTMGDIEAPKGGWFARAMGTDAKARVRAEADAEAFGGTGMSVYDMAELDSVTGYTSRNSGSYLRYTPPKVFNPANTAAAEEAIYDREQILVDSETYKSFQTRIDGVYAPTQDEANAKVAEIKQERAVWLRNNLTEYARSQQDLYGESWVAAMGPTLQAMGLSSDALKAAGRGTDSTTELPAATEEAFDPTTLNLPESLTVDDEGLVNGTITVTHVNKEGEPQDITFEVEGGLVLKDGVPLRPEEAEALLREVSKTTAAPVLPAEEGDGAIEDPIMAAYQEYGQSRKEGTPLTAEDVRSQMGDIGQTLTEAATVATNFTVDTAQTADRGLASAITPLSKFTNGTAMVMASIMDAAGMEEGADNLYQAVADSVNGRPNKLNKGLFASLLDNEGNQGDPDVPSIYGFFKDFFDIDKKDFENNPEAVASIEQLAADIQDNKRQRIGTVGFQDLGLRPAESGVQESPETASDTNLDRMEQSRLGRVGAESDRLSTGSKSMPDGYTPTQMGATELNLPKILEALSPETRKIVEAELQVTAGDTNLGRMEQSRLDRVGMESDRLSTESKSMPDGYIPVQIGATELNLPKVIEGLSVAARNALEKDLKAWSKRPTPRGYQPTQMGATELNLPKMLEALKPKTRNMVEKELQALPETPERNEVNRRELTEGATKIAEMLSRPTSEVSQEELLNFIMEVNAKFGEDAVKAELQRVTRGGATKGGTE